MGGFYGSVQVRSEDRDQVRQVAEQVAKARAIKCLLGPALRGWVGVYPEGGGQDQTIGQEMAQHLSCDVLHVLVHHDDVMAYWLWRGGEMIDSYWSQPAYFGEDQRREQEAMTGRPEAFSHLLHKGAETLRELLRRDRGGSVFECERLEKFASLLGIANAVTAYEYLKQGERDGIVAWKRFEELPGDEIAQEKQAALENRKQIRALKKRLKSSGLLLAEMAKKGGALRASSTDQGLAVAWSNPGTMAHKPILELYASPWKEPKAVPLDLTPQVNGVASDATGARLAAALGNRVLVCAVTDWQILREVRETDLAIAVALSADGRLVAHSSRDLVAVTEVDTGARVKSLPQAARALVFHPSGRFLVAAFQGGPLGIADLDQQAEGRWRDLRVGFRQTVSLEPIVKHLQSLDPEGLERQVRTRMESTMQAQIESWAKEYETRVSDKIIQRMREELEERLKTTVSKLLALRSGPSSIRQIKAESPTSIRFTSDGQWFCCGTDKGLRVYSWSAIAAADGGDMPEPRWHHDTEPRETELVSSGYVYAIAEEVHGSGILFGGIAGQLLRMDLESGAVRRLLTMPEETPITELAMSGDGEALGIVTVPRWDRRQRSRDVRTLWSIWSYPKLLAGAPGQ